MESEIYLTVLHRLKRNHFMMSCLVVLFVYIIRIKICYVTGAEGKGWLASTYIFLELSFELFMTFQTKVPLTLRRNKHKSSHVNQQSKFLLWFPLEWDVVILRCNLFPGIKRTHFMDITCRNFVLFFTILCSIFVAPVYYLTLLP